MNLLKKIPYVTIFLIVCSIHLFTSCAENLPTNDAQVMGLKGNVRLVEEEVYFASYLFDKLELSKNLYKRYYAFDNKGRLTEFTHVNVFLGHRKTYNQPNEIDSLLLEPIITDTAFLPRNHKDTLYLSDAEWDKPQENTLNSTKQLKDPDFVRKDYTYLNDSVYIINNFDKRGYLMSYKDCRLSNGKLRIVKNYSNEDKLLSKSEYNYNSNNKLINQTTYYEKTYYKTNYSYYLGRKYESYSYSARHSVSSYNKNGLIKKQKNYNGKTLEAVLHYKYNKEGNLISLLEVNKINGKEKETTYLYTYDNYGNWIERVEKRYDGNIFVTRRLIDYFSI